eukprot:4232-Heterococcus_DN1.PRE.2
MCSASSKQQAASFIAVKQGIAIIANKSCGSMLLHGLFAHLTRYHAWRQSAAWVLIHRTTMYHCAISTTVKARRPGTVRYPLEGSYTTRVSSTACRPEHGELYVAVHSTSTYERARQLRQHE